MKKNSVSAFLSRFATPVLLIVLGLILIFCPDTASALISNSSFPVQVGFLAPLLHGMDWFRDWSREDLDRFLDLSTQLLKLMKQYDQGQAFSSQPR